MHVLAIDPGLRSGFAWWEYDSWGAEEADYDDFGNWLDTWLAGLVELPDARQQVRIVVERFNVSERTLKTAGSTYWSIELLGVVKDRCLRHGLNMPVLQEPANAKAFASDAKLKKLGWYYGSSSDNAGHADDASRHLLLYLAVNGMINLEGLEGL